MNRKISWDKLAAIYFSRSIGFICKESAQNAYKVKQEILQKISELASTPEIYPADKYKQNNDGSFRYFELLVTGLAI